jgi:hypothetical protein
MLATIPQARLGVVEDCVGSFPRLGDAQAHHRPEPRLMAAADAANAADRCKPLISPAQTPRLYVSAIARCAAAHHR